jgi:hypothetical protein
MGERARDEASQRKLQTSPGLSLIGRAVELYIFFEAGVVMKKSVNS